MHIHLKQDESLSKCTDKLKDDETLINHDLYFEKAKIPLSFRSPGDKNETDPIVLLSETVTNYKLSNRNSYSEKY